MHATPSVTPESVSPDMLAWLFTEPIYVIPEKELVSLPVSVPETAVLPPSPEPAPVVVPTRPVVVVYAHEPSDDLPPADAQLLQKILASVQLSLDDVALVNYRVAKNTDNRGWLPGKSVRHLISFGVHLPELPLSAPPEKYRPVPVETTTVLFVDRLPDLHPSQEKKRQLWKVLKELFGKKGTE